MIRFSCFLIIFISSLMFSNASENYKVTYEHLYRAGVDAYLQNKWYDCIALIEKSLEDYFYYRSVVLQCRLSCQSSDHFPSLNTTKFKDIYLTFFESIVEKALCLSKCDHAYFQNRTRSSKTTEIDFEGKVPYNYLQLCYYKANDIERAASYAYTFLIHNPNHEVMQTNLQYYMSVSNIDLKKIQYLELEDYQELYLHGAHMNLENKYAEVIEIMEKSLQEYLLAENRCRLMCEGRMPEVFEADFYVGIANHFTYTLRCKLNCPDKLSQIYGRNHGNLLSSHYHYLQFSYFKIDELKKSCEAVASYLLFHPQDKTMLTNQDYYSKLNSVQDDWFTPRKEAIDYHHRHTKELDLLNAIEKWFQFDDVLQERENYPTPPPGSPKSSQTRTPNRKLGKRVKRLTGKESEDWFRDSGVSLFLRENELNGTQRVAFQNLLTQKECSQMVDLAKEGAVFGDGYNGKESPHTQFEMFEGLTVARAATMSQRGILDPEVVQLFLKVSDKARSVVEKFFDLESELFFAYTHLVCRTAFSDSPEERSDLSHPIHADNCILTSDGECLKQSPAYVWRDYSSIVYLNNDFEGGEFIFAKDKTTVQASLKPSCGQMVAFSAGQENLHGVKAVRKGKRCALAMWYTLDPRHRERERDVADKIVSELIERRKVLKENILDSSLSANYKEIILKSFIRSAKNHDHDEL